MLTLSLSILYSYTNYYLMSILTSFLLLTLPLVAKLSFNIYFILVLTIIYKYKKYTLTSIKRARRIRLLVI